MEQIKKPSFRRITEILMKMESSIMEGFHMYRRDLQKKYDEARNSVQFLATILRYLKVRSKIEINENIGVVRDFVFFFSKTISPMERNVKVSKLIWLDSATF